MCVHLCMGRGAKILEKLSIKHGMILLPLCTSLLEVEHSVPNLPLSCALQPFAESLWVLSSSHVSS